MDCHFTLFTVLPRQIIIPECQKLVQDYSDRVIVVEVKDDSPDILELFGSDGDNVGSDEHINVSSNCIYPSSL